jgi:hypothetical protein
MNHPVEPEFLTDENYREFANELFLEQSAFTAWYLADVSTRRYWSDDDTDYIRTALNATEALMDLAYDRNRDDLVKFLFSLRDPMENPEPGTLAEIISAGGLCESLSAYEERIYEAEENHELNSIPPSG